MPRQTSAAARPTSKRAAAPPAPPSRPAKASPPPRSATEAKRSAPGGVSVGAHVHSSGGIFTAIDRAASIEAEAVQIFCSSPRMWRATNHSPDAVTKFLEMRAAALPGEVWIHNIYLANLAAEDPAMLEKSVDSVVNALTVADAIGARGVVLHTGSHRGGGIEGVREQVVAALARILDAAPGDAALALETMAGQGGSIGAEFEELGTLLRAVRSPRLQVCMDTCHTFAAGYDVRTPQGVDDTMGAFHEAIGLEHLAVVHANDSKAPLGSRVDRHDNIGDGQIGVDGFRALCAHPALAGKAFLLEVPGYPTKQFPKGDGPDLQNVQRLKAIRDEVAGTATSSRASKRSRAS